MKLHLNLATKPLDNRRPFLAASALLGALAIIALVFLSHVAYRSWRANRDLRAEISGYQDEIRSDRQKQQELEMFFRTPGAQQVLNRAAFLNSLIGRRSFPWTKVFMDLEQTLPPGVRVVRISPALVNDRAKVTLTVGASSDESKIKFLKALEDSKVFSDVEVDQERHPTQTNQQTQGDKVEVSLTVWYTTI
ncbi:MAG: hypothetical protein ACRD4S_14020 [Candidatus Acidiferrales bacterium]